MWYYADKKKKIGPISDAAIRHLFFDGKIKKDTLVWESGSKDWTTMQNSSIYKRITTPVPSQSLKKIKSATYFLRSFAICFVIFLVGKTIYLGEVFNFFTDIWTLQQTMSESDFSIKMIEMRLTVTMLNYITYALLFFLFYFGVKWLFASSELAKSSDPTFNYTPLAAALSPFLPIANFIFPCKVVVKILNASLKINKKTISPIDIAIISSWWLITLTTVGFFTIDFFTKVNGLEHIQVSLCFVILTNILIILSLLLWIMILTRIFKLQKNYLTNYSLSKCAKVIQNISKN